MNFFEAQSSFVLMQGNSFATCDHCRNEIYGTRVVCLDCGSKNTLDFCDKPDCIGCTINTNDNITSPHLPTHGLVKLRASIIHSREIGNVLRNAEAGIDHAEKIFQEQREEKDRSGGTKTATDVTCLRCDRILSQPCWYCIDCPGTSSISCLLRITR